MISIFQNIDPNLTYALGWTIIHSFWQASLIALVMSIIHRFSNNKTSAFKYKISVLSMLSVLLVSAITFMYYSSSATSVDSGVEATIEGTIVVNAPINSSFIKSIQEFCTSNIDHINMIWGIGVLLFLFRFLFSYLYTKFLKSTAILPGSKELKERLSIIKRQLGVDKAIQIAESTKINVPMVIGHVKPIILFPIGLINHLNIDEVDAIITH